MVEPGSPVSVELSLVTDAAEPDGQAGEAASARRRPVEAAFQPVTIHPGDGIPLELKPAGRPGLYAGSFTPDAPGRYEVRHLSGRPEGRVLAGAVVVERPRRERRIVSVDREGLRSLADLSGGDMVEIEAFSSIPYRLDEASTSLFSGEAGRPPGRTRLEDDVWDTWPVLLVLVGLLCADIAIRRLTGSS